MVPILVSANREVRMILTIYDAVMAGVVVLGMIRGAWSGVTWQLASMTSLVLGYIVAHPVSMQLAPYFPGDPVIARSLAMLAVYAGVSGCVFLTAWGVRATLHAMKFEAFDRHLGMLLGGMEGALLGVVATFFVVSLSPAMRQPIFSSPSGHLVGNVMNALGPVLPTEARNALAPFIAEAKQAVATGVAVLPLVAPQIMTTPASASTDSDVQRTSHSDDDGNGTTQRR